MDTINWEDVYLQLYAYAEQLLKTKTWFRKDKENLYLKGKQVHDYVSEAMEKHISAPEGYDPTTGRSLINYLKLHILRSLIKNDANSSENKTSSEVLSRLPSDSENELFLNFEKCLPYLLDNTEQEIDYKEILKEVEDLLQEDPIAKLIFEEVRCSGAKRRDVMKENDINATDFDNGMKRLRTVLKSVATRYHIKETL